MEIKPCKCGAFHGYMLFIYQHGSNWEVACCNCGRSSGLHSTHIKAIEIWNDHIKE